MRSVMFIPDRLAAGIVAAGIVAAGIVAALVGGGAALGLVRPAAAQSYDFRSLIERVERLQRDVDVLQRQLATGQSAAGQRAPAPLTGPAPGGPPPASSYIAQTDQRLAALEQQARELTGKIEELGYNLRQMSQRLDKLVGDVDYRLSQLERGGSTGGPPPAASAPPAGAQAAASPPPSAPPQQPSPILGTPGQGRFQMVPPQPSASPAVPGPPPRAATGAPPPPPPAPAAAPAPVLPAGPPERQYEHAYSLLVKAQREQTDFGPPEQAFRAFVAAHGSHRLAGNAQYWLGETFYVRQDYQQAAAAFGEGARAFPNSDKAPDTWLKLGISLGKLNRKREACGALAEMARRYPAASASVKQVAARERQSLGCS